MIALCSFLATTLLDFPEWEGEFDDYDEGFEEVMGIVTPGLNLIAEQENRAALIAFVQEEVDVEYVPNPILESTLRPLIASGATVVDYGMGLAPFLSECVGKEGRVFSFEKEPEIFRQRYWQLVRQAAANVSLYCLILAEKERTLDAHSFENISLLCIDAGGREPLFLKGAETTILSQKPILLLNMIGGISVEQGDRYIKEELMRRLSEIQKMGYETQRISGSLYLALPL